MQGRESQPAPNPCPGPCRITRNDWDTGRMITSGRLRYEHSTNTIIAYVGCSRDHAPPSLKFIKAFSVGLLSPKAHLIKLGISSPHIYSGCYIFRSPLLLVFTFLLRRHEAGQHSRIPKVINNQELATRLEFFPTLPGKPSLSLLIWKAFKPATAFNNCALKKQANYSSTFKIEHEKSRCDHQRE